VKLSVWAEQQGVSYKTAWRWWKEGKLPVEATQMPSGTVIIKGESVSRPASVGAVALYARVSSSDQKNDLDAQLGRLVGFVSGQKWPIGKTVSEVGSGLNGHRPKLMRLLADKTVETIVVEHRERLMGFGFEYVEAALAAQGRRLVVVEKSEIKDDLVQDMIEVLTSFCARLYGRRSAKHKAMKAVEAIHE
jgi:predicted site-specific integrase-resolvase